MDLGAAGSAVLTLIESKMSPECVSLWKKTCCSFGCKVCNDVRIFLSLEINNN